MRGGRVRGGVVERAVGDALARHEDGVARGEEAQRRGGCGGYRRRWSTAVCATLLHLSLFFFLFHPTILQVLFHGRAMPRAALPPHHPRSHSAAAPSPPSAVPRTGVVVDATALLFGVADCALAGQGHARRRPPRQGPHQPRPRQTEADTPAPSPAGAVLAGGCRARALTGKDHTHRWPLRPRPH